MKYLNWVFVLALTVVAVLFALSNMHVVDLSFWPLPYTAALPVFSWIMIAFVVGFFCGGIVIWWRNVLTHPRDKVAERPAAPAKPDAASDSTAVVPTR